ncbi:hypothetical protein VPH35_056055 [Triticum aestivum]
MFSQGERWYVREVLHNNLQERNGTFASVLYPGHKSLYTNSRQCTWLSGRYLRGTRRYFASGARDFFTSGARDFFIWEVRSTLIFASRGVFRITCAVIGRVGSKYLKHDQVVPPLCY